VKKIAQALLVQLQPVTVLLNQQSNPGPQEEVQAKGKKHL
jgi:hypothetical protein